MSIAELQASVTRTVTPWCEAAGVPAMPPHVLTIVASAITWFSLQYVSSVVSPLLFPQTIQSFNRRTKRNWDVHVVAFVHAALVAPLAARVWIDVYNNPVGSANPHPLAQDRLRGYSYDAAQVFAIALGYFTWDIYISLRYEGPAFIAHGVVSFVAFTLIYSPIFMYDALVFLFWEASTPFLNIHWFLDKLGMTGSIWQLINAAFLLGIYVVVRLIFGVYNSYTWFVMTLFTPHNPPIPLGIKLFFCTGNLTLNSLNFIWFRAMVKAVTKRFQRKTPPAQLDKPTAEKLVTGEQKLFAVPPGEEDEVYLTEAGVIRKRPATTTEESEVEDKSTEL